MKNQHFQGPQFPDIELVSLKGPEFVLSKCIWINWFLFIFVCVIFIDYHRCGETCLGFYVK